MKLTILVDKPVLKVGQSTNVTALIAPTGFVPAEATRQWSALPPPAPYQQAEATVSAVTQTENKWTGTLTAGQKAGAVLITLKAANIPENVSTQAAQFVQVFTEDVPPGVGSLTVHPTAAFAQSQSPVTFIVTGSVSTAEEPNPLIGRLHVVVSDENAAVLTSLDYDPAYPQAWLHFIVYNSNAQISYVVTGQVQAPGYTPADFTITINPRSDPKKPPTYLQDPNGFPEPPAYDLGGGGSIVSQATTQSAVSWLSQIFHPKRAHAQTSTYGCVTLVVTVKDKTTQAPLEGAKVKVTSDWGQTYPTTPTNTNGQAVVNDVVILVFVDTNEGAPYHLEVTYRHPEHQTEYTTTKDFTLKPEEAGKIHEETVELTIPQKADRPCNDSTPQTIKGTIRDKAGNPMANAMLVFGGYNNLAFTNPDGTYTLTDIPPNFSYGLLLFRSDATLVENLEPELIEELECTESGEHTVNVTEL